MTPISPKIFFSILGGALIVFIAVFWVGQGAQLGNTNGNNNISTHTQEDSDTDGDGFYDWEEEIAGTDPEDERSTPNIPHTGDLSWQQALVELPRPGQRQDSFTRYREAFEGLYESVSGQDPSQESGSERAYIESVSWEDNGDSAMITIEGEGFSKEENIVYVGYELAGNPAGIKGFTEQTSSNGTRIRFSLPKAPPSEVANALQWDNYVLTAHWVTVAATNRTPESNQVSFSSPISF